MKAYFHRWRSLVILALLLAPLLWPLQYFAERYYSEQLAEQNRQTLDLYVANLLGTLRRYEELPQILGGLPVLRQALQQPGDPLLQKIANEALADIRRRTGADVIYLLQPDGTTQVASNWAQADSFVHRNFAFRPYYREAMQGRLARFFGLGTTSIKRGYYFASAVKEGSRIIGVLVVKVDLEHIERLWGNSPEQLLVIDNYGVVILSSREDWRFHASRPLSAAERDEIHANIPYPVQDPKPLRLQQSAWLSQSRTLPETGWTVSIYAPRTLIERPVRSVLLIGGATLLALLLLLTLLTLSRRHYLDRIALEAEAKRQLEERVLERTRELENANAQLQQEVHEREQAQRELMRAQDEVVQAGKLTALGTMSASISHELNQPLAAIRSYADNARVLLDHQRTEDARGNLEQISDLTTRMAERLRVEEGSPVCEIKRVRLVNREPVSLEVTYLPQALGERLEKADLVTRDIFLILENDCGIPLGHADLAIDAVLADADLTRALAVEEGAPIMRIERLTHAADGAPLDFEYLYYRGDAFQYRLRIDRQKGERA